MENEHKYVKETWERIERFPDYEISNRGNVYNLRTGELVESNIVGRTLRVSLRDIDNKKCTVAVKNLMVEAFCGAPSDGYVVYFKDGNEHNLHADNLCWRSKRFVMNDTNKFRTLKVRDITTGKIYDSILVYQEETGEPINSIKRAVKNPGKFTTRKGHHLEFVYDECERED